MKILVTGSAGFIGFHLVKQLLEKSNEVIGFDNLNYYYDIGLKYGRLAELGINQEEIKENQLIQSVIYPKHKFFKGDLEDKIELDKLFDRERFDAVVNLAAQAGVRYSIENPSIYIRSNVNGFLNILEACRHNPVKHLVYASSSSVYGANKEMPFSVDDKVDHPVSLYAASKKANELMAYTYSHLFNIPVTGLRFFTVYGPWGRPDMALYIFTKAIFEGRPIPVFNYGNMQRDFTFVDDIVEGIERIIEKPSNSQVPYALFNIGNSKPVLLLDFINALEEVIGKKAIKQMLPLQPGDVPTTWADVKPLEREVGYKPTTAVKDGVRAFVEWYKEYYKI